MKIEVTMEFDFAGTYFDPVADGVENKSLLKFTIDKFSTLLQKWQCDIMFNRLKDEGRIEKLRSEEGEDVAGMFRKMSDDKVVIADQIFNNLQLSGEIEGKPFVFSHKEPGYDERFTYDDTVQYLSEI